MSFRTKLFLVFLVTVLASVSAVTYSVTHYARADYEEMDTQRTGALVAQFQKEFAQQRDQNSSGRHRPGQLHDMPGHVHQVRARASHQQRA